MRNYYNLLLVALLFVSCYEKETNISEDKIYSLEYGAKNYSSKILKNEAIDIGLKFLQKRSIKRYGVNNSTGNITLENTKPLVLKNVETICNESGDTNLYFINTENNGFCVVSGNKNTDPILAFNNSGKINKDSSNYGLNCWLHEASLYVESNKFSNNDLKEHLTRPEDIYNRYSKYTYLYDSIIRKPRVTQLWNQKEEDYYDDDIPSNRALGCGTVAAGMIMASYKYTSRVPDYDWQLIGTNSEEEKEMVSKFLSKLRRRLGTLYFSNATATSTHDMISALHSYGYTAHRKDYSRDALISEIMDDRAVLVQAMGGDWLWDPIKYWDKAHWFVISGSCVAVYNWEYDSLFKNPLTGEEEIRRHNQKTHSCTYYYINWGHGRRLNGSNYGGVNNTNQTSNGWFSDVSKAHNGAYKYEKTLIVNVKPNK